MPFAYLPISRLKIIALRYGDGLCPICCRGVSLKLNMLLKICGRANMVTLEMLAETALQRESLRLRSEVQDFLRQHSQLVSVPHPSTDNPQILGTAAALIELLAQRSGQSAPAWTKEIGAVPEPMFLLDAAIRMKRL